MTITKNETKRDDIFAQPAKAVDDFDFGQTTAKVFDDMLDRSIPLYHELQRQIGELAAEFTQPGTNVYDLGCSTGITMETVRRVVPADVRIIGVDYSSAMLVKARERFAAPSPGPAVELVEADLNHPIEIRNASLVILNLTLQFVRPLYRDSLVKAVYEGLNDKGCLILVEKVLGNHSLINRTFIKLYYDMKKRNGYSETEIARKREALENVLVPYRLDENLELLKRCGFAYSDVFYKWYNFSGVIAVKNP